MDDSEAISFHDFQGTERDCLNVTGDDFAVREGGSVDNREVEVVSRRRSRRFITNSSTPAQEVATPRTRAN